MSLLFSSLSPSAALADDGKFLLAARRSHRPAGTEYLILLDAKNTSKGTYIGKLLTGMSIFAERINPNFIIMDATNQYFRRYGLDRLKLTTLALAEQHKCSLLKAKCVDFIARSPETLDAVLATEGYNHLVASCPLVLTELLRAAHGRRN